MPWVVTATGVAVLFLWSVKKSGGWSAVGFGCAVAFYLLIMTYPHHL